MYLVYMLSNKLNYTNNKQHDIHKLEQPKPVVFGRHFPRRTVVIRKSLPPARISPYRVEYKGSKTQSDIAKSIKHPEGVIIAKEIPNILLTITEPGTRK